MSNFFEFFSLSAANPQKSSKNGTFADLPGFSRQIPSKDELLVDFLYNGAMRTPKYLLSADRETNPVYDEIRKYNVADRLLSDGLGSSVFQ
jgi:hypothetical protein